MLKLPQLHGRVHWSEGMLLSPQHFQAADAHSASLSSYLLSSMTRFFWGVTKIEFDQTLLSEGMVRLTGAECIFPDGTPVQYGAHDQKEPGSEDTPTVLLNLDDLSVTTGDVFTVSLAIAKDSDRSAQDADGDLKRYYSVNEGLRSDISTPSNQIDVVSLRPMLRLVHSDRISPNHTGFPVLKFEKMLDATYQQLDFTPPLLSCGRSDTVASGLWRRLNELLPTARIKAGQLRSLINNRRSDQVVLEQQRLKVICLTARLPAVESQLDAWSHPFDLYTKLLDYACDLARLALDPVAPRFPAYQHNDLNSSFTYLIDFVEQIISGVKLDFIALQFSKGEDDGFVCDFSQHGPQTEVVLSLQIPEKTSRDDVLAWLSAAYICAEEDYESLLIQRSLGFARKRIASYEPYKLVESTNEVLVAVDLAGKQVSSLVIAGADRSIDGGEPDIILSFARLSQSDD